MLHIILHVRINNKDYFNFFYILKKIVGLLIRPTKTDMDMDIPTHVRFHPTLYDDVLKWVGNAKHIMSKEFGKQLGNEHYHLMIYKKLTLDAVRKYFQRLCKTKGYQTDKGVANKWYGGVKLFPTNGPEYVSKEGNIVSSNGFDQETLSQCIVNGKDLFRRHVPLVVAHMDTPLDVDEVYAVDRKQNTFVGKINEFCDDFFSGPNLMYKTMREIKSWLIVHQVRKYGYPDAQATNQRIVQTIYVRLHDVRADKISEEHVCNLS